MVAEVKYRATGGMQTVEVTFEEMITARELLLQVADEAGDELDDLRNQILEGNLASYIIAINGANIHSLDGLDTSIRDKDEIYILLMVAGG